MVYIDACTPSLPGFQFFGISFWSLRYSLILEYSHPRSLLWERLLFAILVVDEKNVNPTRQNTWDSTNPAAHNTHIYIYTSYYTYIYISYIYTHHIILIYISYRYVYIYGYGYRYRYIHSYTVIVYIEIHIHT